MRVALEWFSSCVTAWNIGDINILGLPYTHHALGCWEI